MIETLLLTLWSAPLDRLPAAFTCLRICVSIPKKIDFNLQPVSRGREASGFFLVVPVKPAPPFRHTLPSHHPGACQDRWSHFRKDHRFPVRWIHQTYLVGGIPWYTYPSEKYESQLWVLFPIYGKKKQNVPNHQTVLEVDTEEQLPNNACTSSDIVLSKERKNAHWVNGTQ